MKNNFLYRLMFSAIIVLMLQVSIGAKENTHDSLPDPMNTYQFNRKNYELQNGKIDRKPWFEWWYYKVVLPNKNKSFFFVYGVVNPWDTSHSSSATRALVNVGSFSSNNIIEERFPVAEFNASYTTTQVNVGRYNLATDKRFLGQLATAQGDRARWDISINKKWAFNAESWALGKNITNIEWYPAQADALCSGTLTINTEEESFKDAPCYQDRNWGTLFPEWWTWIVSNHFENNPDSTLALGGGKPTIFDHYNGFESVSIGLKHKGKTYEWRPHEGDYIKFEIKFGQWVVEALNKKYRIKIKAHAAREKFMDLKFMTPQGQWYHDYEALQGDLDLQLYEWNPMKQAWSEIDRLISHQAGIEYGSYKVYDSNSLLALDLCLLGCQ